MSIQLLLSKMISGKRIAEKAYKTHNAAYNRLQTCRLTTED